MCCTEELKTHVLLVCVLLLGLLMSPEEPRARSPEPGARRPEPRAQGPDHKARSPEPGSSRGQRSHLVGSDVNAGGSVYIERSGGHSLGQRPAAGGGEVVRP